MDFQDFWRVYPRRVAKQSALKAWARLKMTPELADEIETALELQKRTPQWQDVQFIPYPATWLNGHRWEDEIEVETWRDECRAHHNGTCHGEVFHTQQMDRAFFRAHGFRRRTAS